jgi:uncharacterized protein (TIGR00369 family)
LPDLALVLSKNLRVVDPDYVARIRDSFSRQGFMRHLGARIDHLGPGTCTLAVDFKDDLAQQHGFFHGGLVGALCDNAGAYAAFTLIEADQSMLTVEYKVNLMAPAKGQLLKAKGEVVRSGRTLTMCQVHAFATDGAGAEELCAMATVTMMTLTSRGDGK